MVLSVYIDLGSIWCKATAQSHLLLVQLICPVWTNKHTSLWLAQGGYGSSKRLQDRPNLQRRDDVLIQVRDWLYRPSKNACWGHFCSVQGSEL